LDCHSLPLQQVNSRQTAKRRLMKTNHIMRRMSIFYPVLQNPAAVRANIVARPRTDPYERNYRVRLFPRKKSSGSRACSFSARLGSATTRNHSPAPAIVGGVWSSLIGNRGGIPIQVARSSIHCALIPLSTLRRQPRDCHRKDGLACLQRGAGRPPDPEQVGNMIDTIERICRPWEQQRKGQSTRMLAGGCLEVGNLIS
jgi:hypothetical protein